MRLSVIIPVYNTAEYLRDCLDSVLSQGIEDLEILCIDDASTDNSRDIIREYQEKDSRIRLFENGITCYAGPSRNRGIEEAKGDYIHFLDSDDQVSEGAYRHLFYILEDTGADVIKGRGVGFSAEGPVDAGPYLTLSRVPTQDFDKPFSFREKPELLSRIGVVPWNGFYRRSLLMDKAIRFNDLLCVNDRSFFNEVTILADSLVVTDYPVVRYRMNSDVSLMGKRATHFDCHFRSYEIILSQLEKYRIGGRAREAVMNRELADIFYWYGKYKKMPRLKEQLGQEMKDFAESLDLSVFGGREKEAPWYAGYLVASGRETPVEKARRFRKGLQRRLGAGRKEM